MQTHELTLRDMGRKLLAIVICLSILGSILTAVIYGVEFVDELAASPGASACGADLLDMPVQNLPTCLAASVENYFTYSGSFLEQMARTNPTTLRDYIRLMFWTVLFGGVFVPPMIVATVSWIYSQRWAARMIAPSGLRR